MKIMVSEDFKYKHITKLPWIVVICWTAILTWAFKLIPLTSYFDDFVRLFIFGISWWFLFQIIDERVTEYRRKILFKNPDIKSAYISNKLAEWNAEDD